ncbi:MAG: DUF6151 family protein [Pseudomonadota bacterium]
MSTSLALSCKCGQFQAILHDVSGANGNRVMCHCKDCQSFAHYLERAEDVLDEYGGSDIFQTSPMRLEVTQGMEQLTCMRLKPKGLTRWHAKCCKTPIGNTMASPGMPFVGLISACMKPADGQALDDILGPSRGRIHTQSAKGDTAQLKNTSILSMLAKFGGIIIKGRLQGAHKKSLFFDAQTRQPIVAPYILSEAELQAVETARDA